MPPLAEEARKEAVNVLRRCAKPVGFYASGLPGGYEALWTRDSMIASLGAVLVEKKFRNTVKRSLETLAKHQAELGQIPNAVGSYNTDRRSVVTYNAVDANLWYIIGHHIYAIAYSSKELLRKQDKNIKRVLLWIMNQDPDAVGLIAQQPTTDWQDAFPHKYGYTINTHALYYAALRMMGEESRAAYVKKVINGEGPTYLSLYDRRRGYYLPWIWKNHPNGRLEEHWFDTLGNILAIITGLATPKIAKRILAHIEKAKINRPYPCKAIFPPIKPGDKEWHSYFATSDAKKPYEYLNAGIWPMIGGFYVAALVKVGDETKAKLEFELLTAANRKVNRRLAVPYLGKNPKWGFEEWLHGKTGEAIGESNPYQAWSAGMYIFAYESIRRKYVPFFL